MAQKRYVFIEVKGGVAYVLHEPEDIQTVIIDYDSVEDGEFVDEYEQIAQYYDYGVAEDFIHWENSRNA